jgi:hypothetical protein
MANEKNVFISHYNQDDEHIQNLKDLLSRQGYVIKNSSPLSKPGRIIPDKVIERLLRMQMNWAGTFICLIGPETHTRRWVNWEIEEAKKQGKQILGIFIHGAKEDSIVPEALEKNETLGITGWNTEKIIDALNGNDVGRCDINGNERFPSYSLARVACQ